MPTGLTLADLLDRELLYALNEAADEDGWASSEQIARQIGIDHPRPNLCVGSRLSWLNRYGVMERRAYRGSVIWRLNKKGRRLVFAHAVKKSTLEALAELDEGERIEVTDALTQALGGSSRQAIHLTRRTWQHRFGNWRDPQLMSTEES